MVLPKRMSTPLKVGDLVKLVSKRNSHWNSSGKMDRYLGEIVEIATLSGECFTVRCLKADTFNWGFRLNDIAEFLPRKDGSIPCFPTVYKEGDYIKFFDRKNMPESHRANWYPNMNLNYGSIVKIVNICGGYFEVTDNNDEPNQYFFDWIERRASKKEIETLIKANTIEADNNISGTCVTPERIGAIALDVFGTERVMLVKSTNSTFSIVIHFPEIDLKNSSKSEHKIRDMFAQFQITNNTTISTGNKCIVRFGGSRTTWTAKELINQYSHSHLSGGSSFALPGINPWPGFCVGYSDYKTLLDNCAKNADADDWYLLFFGLKNYLSWESLEGGPYRRIDAFNSGSQGRILNNNEIIAEVNRMLPSIPRGLWEYIPEGFTINPTNPEVISFFNINSTYKSRVIDGNNNHTQFMSRNGSAVYRFNNTDFLYTVLSDRPTPAVEEGIIHIEPELIQQYCRHLINKIGEFNKNYSYELLKRDNQSIFAPRRMEKQANINSNKELTKADCEVA